MCGIAGFWTRGGLDRSAAEAIGRMTAALRHRGPDDEGIWCDAESGIALGHRRLSIIDLSPLGHQPMASPDGRYVIVYNGEVYNFEDLRSDLVAAGMRFRGHSDTEVILAAFERWGLVDAVRRFAGMFAFALYDRAERTLHLVRDRLGEKPLYYGSAGSTVLFGSELKALRAHPAWHAEVDRGSLMLLLRYGYITAPHTIYEGIQKVAPGTIVSITSDGSRTEQPYWSAAAVIERGIHNSSGGSDAEILESLDQLLRHTVRREMVSDVPLGAFLSGGIDSSLVVALMQAQSSRPVRTFTIGFRETEYNEAHHAGAVARHLGTDHTELYVTPAEAQAVVPRLPLMYDEPLGDSSQVPTYLVSELARRHVTVSLSGDGGDELFGGYDRYAQGLRLWKWLRPMPAFARRVGSSAIQAVSPGVWDSWLKIVGPGLGQRLRARLTGDRLHKLAAVLAVESPVGMYRDLITHWRDPASIVTTGVEPATLLTSPNGLGGDRQPLQLMMALDLVTYLPDDILVKVDRASMAVSLESRAPFLDHAVVEFAWRLPAAAKVRNGRGKWLLRELLQRYVPPQLFDRPKMGFGVPIDHWLRGPLKEWAAALLDDARLRREGFFDATAITTKWKQHLEGSRNWHYLLWDVLMFQAWLEAQ